MFPLSPHILPPPLLKKVAWSGSPVCGCPVCHIPGETPPRSHELLATAAASMDIGYLGTRLDPWRTLLSARVDWLPSDILPLLDSTPWVDSEITLLQACLPHIYPPCRHLGCSHFSPPTMVLLPKLSALHDRLAYRTHPRVDKAAYG